MAGYRALAAAAAAAVFAAGVTACTSGSPTSRQQRPTPGASSNRPAAGVNPLTGERPASNNPVVAVRIDDTAAGRPQAGVAAADIVYITQVEGGLTRLLAIFDSNLPSRVEPVRSTRADNPQLALQYGHIDYVASGGSRPELVPLDRSPLRSDINDRGGPGFARDPRRVAPENLMANLQVIAKKMKGPKARSIGLTWSAHFAAAGTKSGHAVRTTVGATPVEFRWQPKLRRYVRVIDGRVQRTANGTLIATPNVIVQFCRITTYWKDRDAAHNPAAWTHTVGHGRVVVFRDGRQLAGTWSRHDVNSGTLLRDAHGNPISLAPGGAWFVLAKNGTPLR